MQENEAAIVDPEPVVEQEVSTDVSQDDVSSSASEALTRAFDDDLAVVSDDPLPGDIRILRLIAAVTQSTHGVPHLASCAGRFQHLGDAPVAGHGAGGDAPHHRVHFFIKGRIFFGHVFITADTRRWTRILVW